TGAVDEAGENVASELIGAQRKFPALRRVASRRDDLGFAMRRDQRREQRTDYIDGDDDHAEPGADRRLLQLAPGNVAAAAARGDPRGGGDGFGGHLGRNSRGLVMIEMMSAERLS